MRARCELDFAAGKQTLHHNLQNDLLVPLESVCTRPVHRYIGYDQAPEKRNQKVYPGNKLPVKQEKKPAISRNEGCNFPVCQDLRLTNLMKENTLTGSKSFVLQRKLN